MPTAPAAGSQCPCAALAAASSSGASRLGACSSAAAAAPTCSGGARHSLLTAAKHKRNKRQGTAHNKAGGLGAKQCSIDPARERPAPLLQIEISPDLQTIHASIFHMAGTSMGSPSGVPVPCISRVPMSDGCSPASASASRITCHQRSTGVTKTAKLA